MVANEIIDPTTNNNLEGCIVIAWSDEINQYITEYDESCIMINTCESEQQRYKKL